MDTQITNKTLDFLGDFYKILKINEEIIYGNIFIYNDIYYKNKIGQIIDKHFNLPDDYISVDKNGIVIEKTYFILHRDLMNIISKVQKKYYKNEDKLGVNKNSNIISSFYEDSDYICEIYMSNRNKTKDYIKWLIDYSKDIVYVESEDYKFYGKDNKTIKLNKKSSLFKIF